MHYAFYIPLFCATFMYVLRCTSVIFGVLVGHLFEPGKKCYGVHGIVAQRSNQQTFEIIPSPCSSCNSCLVHFILKLFCDG